MGEGEVTAGASGDATRAAGLRGSSSDTGEERGEVGGPVAESFPSEGGNALLTLKRLGEDEAGCSFHGEGSQTIAGK